MKPCDDYGPNIVGPCHVKEVRRHILYNLGQNIKQCRRRNEETLDELAYALNIEKSTLSKYENGELEIPSSTLPMIAGRYNASLSELFGEELPTKNNLEIELFKDMIKKIMCKIDDITLDKCYYENIFVNYFMRYLATDQLESFDTYYAVSLLLEQIDNLHINGYKEMDFEMKKVKMMNEFLANLIQIRENEYKINYSVFMNDLITVLSDKHKRNWNDYYEFK